MSETLSDKLARLIRRHRQRVFDANGERHTRAIHRLKATPTARAIYAGYDAEASIRQGERLTRMGY